MKTLKNDWLIWLIILSPYVLVAMKWDSFPEQVPMHWNMEGEIDRYGSKTTGLLLLPSINILVYLLFLLLPLLDPKGKNYALFADKFKTLRILIHLFLSGITFTVCFVSLGYALNVEMIMQLGIICLFLAFGNFLGNIRPNYFVGIRVPWTLANEQVWTLTHRFAGKIWVGASLLMLPVCYFLKGETGVIFYIYLGVITVIPIVYSFITFKRISTGKQG